MAMLSLLRSRQTNGYVKTIGTCTKPGYRPVDRQMAVETIDACTEAGYTPAGRQVAMLKL